EGDRRAARDRAAPPRRQRGVEGRALRRRALRELPLLPRGHRGHLLLLAPQAAHPGRRELVVPVVGGRAGELTDLRRHTRPVAVRQPWRRGSSAFSWNSLTARGTPCVPPVSSVATYWPSTKRSRRNGA